MIDQLLDLADHDIVFVFRSRLAPKPESRVIATERRSKKDRCKISDLTMKARLKYWYKIVDRAWPAMGVLIRRLYDGKPFNTINKRISGTGHVISYGNSILSSVTFDIQGKGNVIEISEGCRLNGVTFHLHGDNHHILVGKECIFDRGGSLWFEDSDCSLFIGNQSTFEDVHIAVTEPGSKVTIGHDCMFAYDIDIRTGDSHSIISAKSNERINYARDVFVGNHVWVAAHSILLKGVHIADNSVVATGSVVTRRFEQTGIVIAGNPAVIVKDHVTWSRNRIYKVG